MGDYRVFKEVLGHSEFGTVYYGEDFNQNKYAIKVYSKKKMSEPIFKFLKREADILKKMINTPYVVQIKNSSEIDDIFYIILELCDESLKNLVLAQKPPSSSICYELFQKIYLAYLSMLSHRVIHRNINPSVILVQDDKLKISAFEKAIDVDNYHMPYISRNAFNSPQILENKSYTSKTDIWSLGVTFYWICFRELPWGGYTPSYTNRCKKQPQFPEDFSAKLKGIILRCLKYTENDRASIEELCSMMIQNPQKQLEKEIINTFKGIFNGSKQKSAWLNTQFNDSPEQIQLNDPMMDNILADILQILPEENIISIYEGWRMINRQQEMSPNQFKKLLQLLGNQKYNENAADRLIRFIDSDQNGKISLQQILDLKIERKNWKTERQIKKMNVIVETIKVDLKKQNKTLLELFISEAEGNAQLTRYQFVTMLTRIELQAKINEKLTEEDKKNIFDRANSTNDRLSFEKFKNIFSFYNSQGFDFEKPQKIDFHHTQFDVIEISKVD